MKRTIRELRDERRWSRAELADILGVSVSAVQKWEEGQAEPRASRLLAMATEFSVSPYDIEFAEFSGKRKSERSPK
jgi:transcriptional regulator with XRE-family HTH domain